MYYITNLRFATVLLLCALVGACAHTSSVKWPARASDIRLSDDQVDWLGSHTQREMPSCGNRIPVRDVLAVDMYGPGDERDRQLQEAGTYELMSGFPVCVHSEGSLAGTVKKATRAAANNGCDLLLLKQTVTLERMYVGTPGRGGGKNGISRCLLVESGLRTEATDR